MSWDSRGPSRESRVDLALEIRGWRNKGREEPLREAPEGALPRLDLGRMPIAGPLLIGRKAELALLDAAWEDPDTRAPGPAVFGA